MLPGWYTFPRLPPGFRRNFTQAIATQLFALKLRIIYLCDSSDDKMNGILNCPLEFNAVYYNNVRFQVHISADAVNFDSFVK